MDMKNTQVGFWMALASGAFGISYGVYLSKSVNWDTHAGLIVGFVGAVWGLALMGSRAQTRLAWRNKSELE
jgi:hypothetical protein